MQASHRRARLKNNFGLHLRQTPASVADRPLRMDRYEWLWLRKDCGMAGAYTVLTAL